MIIQSGGLILIVVSVDPDHVVNHASHPNHLQVFDWSGDFIRPSDWSWPARLGCPALRGPAAHSESAGCIEVAPENYSKETNFSLFLTNSGPQKSCHLKLDLKLGGKIDVIRDKMKIRSQRGWRVRELMANQRCFEKKGNFIFLPSKAHGNVGKCHLKMNSSDSHFLLVLKDSVISVQISQLIRDFNFQLCTFILKMSMI